MAARQTQPYRKGARSPSSALVAMTRGRGVGGVNPADTTRAGYLIAAGQRLKRTGGGRTPRSPRTPR